MPKLLHATYHCYGSYSRPDTMSWSCKHLKFKTTTTTITTTTAKAATAALFLPLLLMNNIQHEP